MIQFVRAAIFTVLAAVVAWAAFRFFYMRRHHRVPQPRREFFLLVVVCYAAAVFAFVLMPVAMTRNRTAESAMNNFVPFHTMRAAAEQISRNPNDPITHDTVNVVGNILMFIPMGLFLPL